MDKICLFGRVAENNLQKKARGTASRYWYVILFLTVYNVVCIL